MNENYDPQKELERIQTDENLPPLEDLPGGEALTGFPQFPLSTHDGITAAWNYISDPGNQDQHDQYAVESFKQRVQAAARDKGVDLGNVG